MEDMEIGEYARTEDGEIYKYVGVSEYFGKNMNDYEQDGELYQLIGDIAKHSDNILDIIEEGDFVNGYIVEEITIKKEFEIEEVYTEGCGTIQKKDIEEILTKEKYIANRYSLIQPEEDDEYEIIEDETIIKKLIK